MLTGGRGRDISLSFPQCVRYFFCYQTRYSVDEPLVRLKPRMRKATDKCISLWGGKACAMWLPNEHSSRHVGANSFSIMIDTYLQLLLAFLMWVWVEFSENEGASTDIDVHNICKQLRPETYGTADGSLL